jgi:hypothetical protein
MHHNVSAFLLEFFMLNTSDTVVRCFIFRGSEVKIVDQNLAILTYSFCDPFRYMGLGHEHFLLYTLQLIIHSPCYLTPDTLLNDELINWLTRNACLSTLELAVVTHPYAHMQIMITSDQWVLRSLCGSLSTVSSTLTFLFVKENLVTAVAACVTVKLGSCLGCEVKWGTKFERKYQIKILF